MAAALLLSTVLPGAKSPISHYNSSHKRANSLQPTHNSRSGGTSIRIRALQETKEEEAATAAATDSSSADDITQKYGLEFGLWKIFNSSNGEGKEKSKTDQAKELLAKYGGAYLATSITLSLFSFTLCYLLINAGVDVQSLLNKVGIVTDEAGGKVGTFALAYAAHKAASPIRFPPTVALTPIVAGWIGKKTPKASDQ